eukprot:CAMPEP_0118955614 /NCGR_PEP_ID=MMETSP1169-20130426/60265_1 /TAXON_ID=36882 /ORGANISM="Pyramimonas obovata, Strain CCMP722" /LENGTH=116 /DNA_ID=CAMNT_0006903499 /DNA_START=502 /DNA_END=849 /DNA_ORIENTATION=-
MLRLMQIMEWRMSEAQSAQQQQPTRQQTNQVYEQSLGRLRVMRCSTSFQLLAALKGVRPILKGMQEAGAAARLLLVDSVSAFYWMDRAARNAPLPPQAGARSLPHQGVAPMTLQSV